MIVRRADPVQDADPVWAILEPMLRAGETYAMPRDWSRKDALAYWLGADKHAFVAEDESAVLGVYYLRTNQMGGGAHVCNCGYVTAPNAQGRGVARAMAEHSFETARALGYRAMQYNFVVATNERAIGLWRSYGFEVVGALPGAFDHPKLGYVDALVMFRTL
ncbi:GNAT family N-acetyltransferase [Oceanicaulis sp. MMSF_3324]|uniref:GNAT family N-acetyltransferase n=1 Tax=Oceanicaulis sp. MMSF_3324 TaxID=3046702 RepID=UPI00273E9FA2|nr:N-acetyltransferase [Oceanicaulis sp. MMSF_3324]